MKTSHKTTLLIAFFLFASPMNAVAEDSKSFSVPPVPISAKLPPVPNDTPLCKDVEYDMLLDMEEIVKIPMKDVGKRNEYRYQAYVDNVNMPIGYAVKQLLAKKKNRFVVIDNQLSYSEYGRIDGMLITLARAKPCLEK